MSDSVDPAASQPAAPATAVSGSADPAPAAISATVSDRSAEPGAPVTSPRLRWVWPLAAVLVVIWLAVGGMGGPKIGGLSKVASNDSASYLPQSSESAQAAALLRGFTSTAGTSMIPAIVVAERADGVIDSDVDYLADAIGSYYASLADSGSLPDSSDSSSESGPGRQVAISQDGQAAQAAVLLPATDSVRSEISNLRDMLDNAPDGLTVLVTGPAGLTADLVHAFGGIDGVLLVVAAVVVALILLIVYRGPLLVLLVLLSTVFALSASALVVYQLASAGTIALSGMSQGILFILVFGAATDYALLLVSRYRQELRDEPQPGVAMVRAWRAVFAPVTASAATVVLGLLCLLFSDLASTRDLGPIAAIGIGAAYLASMTFLPAVLLLTRRASFWPLVPHAGTDHPETGGLWQRISGWVERKPRAIWAVTALVLVAFAALMPGLKAHGTTQSDVFLTSVDSVAGEDLLEAHFPGGTGSPTTIVAHADAADDVISTVQQALPADAISDIAVSRHAADDAPSAGRVAIDVTLDAAPSTPAAFELVQQIRDAVHDVPGADALVGGQDALQLDTNLTSERDRSVIIPIVLIVVFLVLAILLRALLAPLVLMATVVLSYLATLGVAAVVFNHVFGFPGADPSVPLFAFVFLVALGIDYNIFLMTRVREETVHHGTHRGVVRGLALTGGVITSAGVVLAATFAALSVLPILFLAQIAFLVAFGVLLDTIVVRSLLVPALTLHIGPKIWWPSRLARQQPEAAALPESYERNRRQKAPPA